MLRKAAWVGRGHILDEGEKGKAFILVWQSWLCDFMLIAGL